MFDPDRIAPEIEAALAAFIADSKPYLIHIDPPLDLRAVAAQTRLLPVTLDGGGCLGLLPSGRVASFLWDEPHHLREEQENRIRNLVYYQASLKFPSLASLAPVRPAGATDCPYCGGTGRCSDLGEELSSMILCYCGGLGWLPNDSSTG